ncbi:hypothetical protein GCM10023169_22200 [Georgenia halophila]|uniref:Uncharacterized protein n=1 Tax=Georgenia halophila TaxID=620889 RepID=A0ABP8LB12_9MICO
MLNTAEGGVDVQLGDDEVNDVTADGGALLYTNECFDGPIVVTYAGGRTVKLAVPICPGQELVVTDEGVELVEAESTT